MKAGGEMVGEASNIDERVWDGVWVGICLVVRVVYLGTALDLGIR
jgi:hypothetical protein